MYSMSQKNINTSTLPYPTFTLAYPSLHLHEQLTRQQTKQHNTTQHNDTRDNNLFSKKKLPQVGLEPTTLCSLDECSTTWATEAVQMVRAQITYTTQYNARQGVSIPVL